jgi:glyoxylase-like metal-dependent hydrolase (beta-lactamase superfamily II)
MTEADLADLGVFRIPVPVPFPQAGGPVNAYLVEEADGGLLMWDAGLGSPDGERALEAGFHRLGRRFDEVRRIVVSHGHVDHYGAARFVQERHGGTLPVFAHPADVPKIAEEGRRWRDRLPHYAAYLARLGVPADALAVIAQEGEKGFRLARRVPAVRPIGEGEVLRTRHLDLRVVHMPGHTPGLLCLHDPRRRLFFSDDHLLEKISPNPLIELGPNGEEGVFRPLLAYVASALRMRELELDLVLPGHGPPFTGHRAIIDALLGFYAQRQARLRELLDGGPMSAHELARAIFPRARTGDLFLTISETIANLEAMEARGEVSRELVDGVYRFR